MMDGNRKAYVRQYTAAFSGTLIMFANAAVYGWTSPTIPKLLADDSPIPITRDEASWIVSLMLLGSILGPFISFLIVDKIGRKITLLLTSIPIIIGLILVLVATSPGILYVSRIFCGITNGMIFVVMPMYLGEISSDKIRGSIGTLMMVMTTFGILFVFSIGPYISITLLAWILLVLPALFICTFIWLPESPYFLLLRKRKDVAEKNLKWLRKSDDVTEELERMDMAVMKAQENRGTLRELFTSGNRHALIIGFGLAACQQWCGSQAVIAYSEEIFSEVANGLSGSESAIILGAAQLITAALSSSIVDRLGRRPLLLLSSSGVSICNVIVGLYFFLLHRGVNMDAHAWLPITTLMIFIVMFSIGLATVPYALQSELFPTNIKAIAIGCITIFGLVNSFAVMKLYQVVSDGLGIYVTFWGFAVFSIGFVIFTYFLVPETKGQSLDAILEDMNSRENIIKK